MEGTPQEVVSYLEDRINRAVEMLNRHTTAIDDNVVAINKINDGRIAHLEMIKKAVEAQLQPYQQEVGALAATITALTNDTKPTPSEPDNNSEFEKKKIWRKSVGLVSKNWYGDMYRIERDLFNESTVNYYNLNQANELVDLLNKKE